MFKPFNLLAAIVCLYLLFPILGFGLFPEYFSFSESTANFTILGCYILIMLASAAVAKKVEAVGHHHNRVTANNPMFEKWPTRAIERRALAFAVITAAIALFGMLLVVTLSGMLGADFSPHDLRMTIASGGNLLLTIAYNMTSLFILISINLTFISLKKSNKQIYFKYVLAVDFLMIIATGQRSMLMLALCSYLLLGEFFEKNKYRIKSLITILAGLTVVIALGVARQGDEYSYASIIWQTSVRFDLFYPQFFNFLDVYRGLNDIGYGYFHLTYPLQIIPSSIMQSKPETFLQFINRDLMNISEGTGNDFTAYAEFIYNYGVIIGAFFYSVYCFVASFLIQRIYRRAQKSPIYFALYFPSFLVYLSLVLLTGLSNQAHIFAAIGLLLAIIPCKLFVRYTAFKKQKTYDFTNQNIYTV